MKKLALVLITTLLFNPCFAATVIKQNQPAPQDGILFSQQESDALHDKIIDLKLIRKENDILTQENNLLNQQVDFSQKHINNLSQRLVEQKDDSLVSKIGYFLVGVGCASLTVFAVNKASK